MANQWLPLKSTSGAVRHIHISRPGEYTPPPVPQGGMVYVFLRDNQTSNLCQVCWSPQTNEYVLIESWHDDEADGQNALGAQGTTDAVWWSMMHRTGSATTGRGRSKESISLPPGYTSISLFRAADNDEGSANSRTVASRIPTGFTSAYNDIAHSHGHGNPSGAWRLVNGKPQGQFAYYNRWTNQFSTTHPGGLVTHPANPPDTSGNELPNQAVPPGSPATSWIYSGHSAERNYGETTILRGYMVEGKVDPTQYRPVYAGWPVSASGIISEASYDGDHKIQNYSSATSWAEPTDNPTLRFMSNDYVILSGSLYHYPPDPLELDGYADWLGGATQCTGLTGALDDPEQFDTYWALTSYNDESQWALHYVDTFDPKVWHVWTKPAEMITYLDGVFGQSNWRPYGAIATTNLTTECAFLIRSITGSYLQRLMLARTDGTWADISGNIWESYEGAPALFPQGTVAYAIRHVLSQEYDPYQQETPNNWSPPEPVSMPTAYSQAVANEYPYLYLRLEESAGATTAADSSGNGRNGTYQNPGSITFGQPNLIDGGTAIQIASPGCINLGNLLNGITMPFTFEMMINKTAHASGTRYLIDSGSSPRFVIRFTTTAIEWTDGGSTASFGNFTSGQKTHLAIVGSGNQVKCYVNGALLGTVNSGAQTLGPTTKITTAWDGPNTPVDWAGVIDEVAFYRKALSAAVILDHAQKAGVA